jgi:hypothetical protein
MQERVVAAAELVGRTGATGFELGYLHDDVPASEAAWYAHAQYRGARITAENHSDPGSAAEALARRLLTGARCSCGRLVQLRAGGAIAFERPVMSDGSTWTAAEAAAAGQCRWTRRGARWERECDGAAP